MLTLIKRKFHNLISDEKFSEILTGSAWALSFRVIGAGLGLISSIVIARLYGAELLGIVAMLDASLMLVTILAMLGTNTAILRLIPEHLVKYSPASAFNVYRKTLYLVIGASLLTGVVFFSCASPIADKVFNKPHLSFFFALTAVFVVFKTLMLLNTEAVRGLRLIRTFSFMQIMPHGFNLLLLLLLGLLVSTRYVPVYAQLCAYALTGILGWAIMEYAFKKRMAPQDIVHSMTAREILFISLPMLMTSMMVFIIGQTGILMLGIFRPEADVGYYAIAVKLATLTSFMLQAVNSMAGPRFSELFSLNKTDELFYVARKSAKLIFWITSPILLGLIVFGKPILSVAFGATFSMAYPALVILVIGQFVHSISGATGLFMNMIGKQKTFHNIMFLTLIANVVLNLLLIPKYGIYGAALTAMVSLSGWNIATLCYMKRVFGRTTGYFPTHA